jgi:hypothetical protein
MITEPNPVISGGSETLTFTLTCVSAASSLSGTSSVKVVQLDSAAPASGGGGGSFDPLALLFLVGVLGVPRMRRVMRWRVSAALGPLACPALLEKSQDGDVDHRAARGQRL